MTTDSLQSNQEAAALPPNAPTVRVVAGKGTPGQKSWHLFRPATLIGAKRPAHIVLHDEGIENAHCVILNTVRDVVIQDLCTDIGTLLNGEPVLKPTTLEDGDQLRIGDTVFDITVEWPETEGRKPAQSPPHLVVLAEDLREWWAVEGPSVSLGRHARSHVHLDHDNVAECHAVLFRFGDGVAVFDTASENGVFVNGSRVVFAVLRDTDRLVIGAHTLRLVKHEKGEFHPPWEAAAVMPAQPVAPARSPFARLQKPQEIVKLIEQESGDTWKEKYVVSRAAGTPHMDPESWAKSLEKREKDLEQRERRLIEQWTALLSMKCAKCGAPVRHPGAGPA